MTDKQPEALRLADEFRGLISAFGMTERGNVAAAERELRRLHALCEEIAEIAHNGGLVGMSESSALTAIRKITLSYWRQSK